MKNIVKIFFIVSLLYSFSYCNTPFSLEGIKSVNVLVINKGKLISKNTIDKIEKEVKILLEDMNIKTETSEFANFIVKIEAKKVLDKFAVNVTLLLVESVRPQRNQNLINTAITYQKNDFFITESLDLDVYESAVEFLLPSFQEQYEEEK